MPWSKVANHPECNSGQIAVVKNSNGEVEGCHDSEEKANAQLAALNASEDDDRPHKDKDKKKKKKEQKIMEPNKYIRAYAEVSETRAQELRDDISLPVPFIASTEGVKADGIDLRMGDWDLNEFGRYGPIMWVHDYWHPPVGTGQADAGEKLRIDVTFDQNDPFAMLIRSKSLNGMMAGSVGWETDKKRGKNILKEFSMVPLGLDPDALPEVQRMGLRAMQREISDHLGELPEDSLEQLIAGVTSEMREQIAKILEEYMTISITEEDLEEESKRADEDSTTTLGETSITGTVAYMDSNGTFYELQPNNMWAPMSGESTNLPRIVAGFETNEEEDGDIDDPEELLARAGAVLSNKNRDDLQMALDAIQRVIERATPDDDGMFIQLGQEPDAIETREVDDDDVHERGNDEDPVEPQEPGIDLDPHILDEIKAVLSNVEPIREE